MIPMLAAEEKRTPSSDERKKTSTSAISPPRLHHVQRTRPGCPHTSVRRAPTQRTPETGRRLARRKVFTKRASEGKTKSPSKISKRTNEEFNRKLCSPCWPLGSTRTPLVRHPHPEASRLLRATPICDGRPTGTPCGGANCCCCWWWWWLEEVGGARWPHPPGPPGRLSLTALQRSIPDSAAVVRRPGCAAEQQREFRPIPAGSELTCQEESSSCQAGPDPEGMSSGRAALHGHHLVVYRQSGWVVA
jgi:hypothetical protein